MTLQIHNVDKLLATLRVGLDLSVQPVRSMLDEACAKAMAAVDNILPGMTTEDIGFTATTGMVFTETPLFSVCVYVTAEKDANGKYAWGRFGVELIPAERGMWGGRTAQIPHLSIRMLFDGWRNETIRAPLGFVCSDWDLTGRVVVYEHRYFPPVAVNPILISKAETNLIYVGVTRKNWASRWKEHQYSARSGSPYDFHEAIRTHEGRYHSMHTVLSVVQDWDVAMAHEERLVAQRSLRPKGLNMIPGGKAGIAFAAKYGAAAKKNDWEHREKLIKEMQTFARRAGLANPAQSLRLSTDADLMWKMVEARQNTFSGNDIALIRSMAAREVPWQEIARELGVASARRVRDVVDGETYRFVK